MSSLKPCPFCGGEKIELCHYQRPYGSNDPEWFSYFCCDCAVSQDEHTHRSIGEAIKAWNTRHPNKELIEKVEKMKPFTLKCRPPDDEEEVPQAVRREDVLSLLKGKEGK